MSIKLPDSVPIPQPGLMALLSGGIGQGISSAVDQKSKLSNALALSQVKEGLKRNYELTKPFTEPELMNYAKSYGLKETDLQGKLGDVLNKTNELTKSVGRNKAVTEVFSNLDKYTKPQEEQPNEQLTEANKEKSPSSMFNLERAKKPLSNTGGRTLWNDLGPNGSFAKGIKRGSAGKLQAILSGQSLKDYEKASKLDEKANVWDHILYTIGNLSSDAPALIGGGAAGGAIGGPLAPVTGTMGAFALPSFLNSSLNEFMKLKDKGGQGSFEDYINALGEVSSQTMQGSATGAIFGSLSKLFPIIKAANPKIAEFFEEKSMPKLKTFLGTSTIEAMGLTAAEATAKRQLPTMNDVAENFAQVFGFNLLATGSNKAKGIVERIRRAENPTETLSKVKNAADKAGIDNEKVEAGDPVETRKLERIVTDITKTAKTTGQEKKLPGKELSTESLESRATATKEKAEQLSEAPLKEYLKEPPKETPSIKAEKERAGNELSKLDNKVSQVQENVDKLNAEIEKGIKNKKSLASIEKAKSNFESQLEKLNEQRKDLEYRSRTGREPYSQEKTQKTAEERVKRLEDMSRNPEKYTSEDWEKEFKGESDYLQNQINILKRTKGTEPIEPYKDRHIKALETYNKLYQKGIKNIDKALETAKGKEKANLEKIKNNLKRNLAINDARLTKHRDKLSVKKDVKQGSALMRHYLQQMRAELPQMQKPIIEAKKAIEGLESKAEKVFNERIKQPLEDISKNPNQESKIENLIDENTSSEKEKANAKEDVKRAKENEKKVKEVIENGIKKGESSKSISKKLLDLIFYEGGKKYLTRIGKALAGALTIGYVKKYLKEKYDIKVPYALIALSVPFTKKIKFGAAAVGMLIDQVTKKIKIKKGKEEYQKLTSPIERRDFRQKLEKEGWKKAEINKVVS